MSTSYQKLRTLGGLKGLGTGARSYRKGGRVVNDTVTSLTTRRIVPQQQTYYGMPRRRYGKREIKTVDHTFEGGLNTPYNPDVLAKGVLNINTTAAMQALMIQQGTGSFQRVGNQCQLKSIRLRFRLFPTNAPEVLSSMARMMLIYDKQPNGAYPTTATILANINEAGTTSAFDPEANLNVANMDRFIVLMDERCIVPGQDAGGVFQQQGPFDEACYSVDRFIKLRGLEQRYSATSSPMVIANQTTGALYLFTMGSVVAASEPYAFYGTARLRYYDS